MQTVELMVAIYSDPQRAVQKLDELEAERKNGALQVIDLAAISRTADGSAAVTEPAEMTAGQGTLFGALVGAIVGLIGGPAGAVAGAMAGAATGGLVAKTTDLGFEDTFLEELKQVVQPGSSILVVLVERQHATAIGLFIGGDDVRLLRNVLKKEAVKRLSEK